MRRSTVFVVVALLLVLPTLGSANPNGVGSGTVSYTHLTLPTMMSV